MTASASEKPGHVKMVVVKGFDQLVTIKNKKGKLIENLLEVLACNIIELLMPSLNI